MPLAPRCCWKVQQSPSWAMTAPSWSSGGLRCRQQTACSSRRHGCTTAPCRWLPRRCWIPSLPMLPIRCSPCTCLKTTSTGSSALSRCPSCWEPLRAAFAWQLPPAASGAPLRVACRLDGSTAAAIRHGGGSTPLCPALRWDWKPDFGMSDPLARRPAKSPVFRVGDIDWRLCAYLNGSAADQGNLSVYLVAPQLRNLGTLAALTFSVTVKGRTLGPAQRLMRNEGGWGWPRVLGRGELDDPRNGFLVGGALAIPITVQLSFRRLAMPAKEWAWLLRARTPAQWCWHFLRGLAAALLHGLLLLLVWCACAVAFHFTLRTKE